MSIAHLLTGEPGIGKTTALKRIVQLVGSERCGGFYTEEIRVDGVRTGFRIVTLDGVTGTIADVTSTSELRVGKYGVDLASLEKVGVGSITRAVANRMYVVIDEIGPMQLFSEPFKHAVLAVLNSPKVLFGTVVQRPYPWADDLKLRSEVRIHTITIENRDSIADQVALEITGNRG